MAIDAVQHKEMQSFKEDAEKRDIADEIAVSVTSSLASIEADWRLLETTGLESPGQSFDFIRQWTDSFAIPEADQVYIVAHAAGRPVALMPLHRVRMWGMNVLASFAGSYVGTNAPLIDRDYLSGLDIRARRQFWQAFTAQMSGADLAYICSVPDETDGADNLFEGFGLSMPGDRLHRSIFANWEQCDSEQRNRSRRKHDKQQGQKLQAMGAVEFEIVDAGADVSELMCAMFRQRSDRFKLQGIADPFAEETVRDFFKTVFANGTSLKGRLHVLRLEGEVVAVRYNLISNDRIFCLISSMSVAPEIQPGSPGKQCLLRVMQTEFDAGYSMFDMGAGMTDEKRHWCNVHIPMNHHYVPLSARGQLFSISHAAFQNLKARVKDNEKLFAFAKTMRARLAGNGKAA